MKDTARSATWMMFLCSMGAAATVGACGGKIADQSIDPGVSETGGGSDGSTSDGPIGVDAIPGDDVISVDVIPTSSDGSTEDTSIFPDTPVPEDTGVIGSDTAVTDSGTVVDSGTTVDSGTVVDTGADTGIDGGTIDTTCTSLQDGLCTSATKACCSSKGVTYDDLGCRDRAGLWCKVGFDAVVGGKATFDASQVSACKTSWASLEAACSTPFLNWVKGYAPCSRIFSGTVAPGGSCAYPFECKVPASNGVADCDGSSKRCRTYEVITTVGAACNYFGSAVKWCDYGMYCDYASGGAPTCKKAVGIGGSCFGADDTSCGLGNVCKSGKCAVGAPFGAKCTYDLECASWSCNLGSCTDPNFEMANKSFCYGG